MTISEIFDTARELAWQSQSAFYTNVNLLKYLNIEYHKNVDYIATKVKWWRYWAEYVYNLVEWTNTYVIPQTSSVLQGIKEVHRLEIKVNWSRIVLKERKMTNLQYDPIEYSNCYIVKWSSIELVNTGHKTETGWLKIMWLTDVANLTVGTAESAINVPYDRGYVLALWIVPYIHALERRFDEESNARNRYKVELRDKIAQAKLKRYQTIYKDNPDYDTVYRE